MKKFVLLAAMLGSISLTASAKSSSHDKPSLGTILKGSETTKKDLQSLGMKLPDLHVIPWTFCGHYTWIMFYTDEQYQERVTYFWNTYCGNDGD